MNLVIFQKERVINEEIEASTISNYCKPIKFFCDVNDILLNWKFISRWIPIVSSVSAGFALGLAKG